MEVFGTLKITNINAPPIDFVCSICQSKKITRKSFTTCFCRTCDNITLLKKVDDNGKIVAVNIYDEWVQTILDLPESLPISYEKAQSPFVGKWWLLTQKQNINLMVKTILLEWRCLAHGSSLLLETKKHLISLTYRVKKNPIARKVSSSSNTILTNCANCFPYIC
ncbi:hypothetical protein O6H91_03G087800 [Diphasiastrum complanatum]|uniref:Uncharacterized protein n=1 Tax=Diphasiastrum complanatum TaxID=34168 RepID=A0ACC2E951_DIPCM|nr:hypothetical protein O6H91_03G087800 [Diphasiastrum complanatum]